MRVLRATDIIPPFGKIPAPVDTGDLELEPSEPVEPVRPEVPAVEIPASDDAEGDSAEAGGEIPKYDLAENILAEQRRVAGRRRRAPSQPQDEPEIVPEPAVATPSKPELPSEDLPELQKIVAEIVARDIERLCRRPDDKG